MTEARSSLPLENLQEFLDANGGNAKSSAMKGLAQFFTPRWFAQQMARLLPGYPTVVFDPQSGRGDLLQSVDAFELLRVGVELDKRQFTGAPVDKKQLLVNASCLDFWRTLDEFYPNLRFGHQVSNPPFGLTWNTPQGPCDSTLYTWRQMVARAGAMGTGFLIANRPTIERLGLHTQPIAYLYQTFPVGIFATANVEVGVVHFHTAHRRGPRVINHRSSSEWEVMNTLRYDRPPDLSVRGDAARDVQLAVEHVSRILAEDKRDLPPFNVWLDRRGFIRTYLSTRETLTRKLKPVDIERLSKANNCHPLTLTTEKDTRRLLSELVDLGIYTVQPEATEAIRKALVEVSTLAQPIMPVTDFERVAYADEEEQVTALARPLVPHRVEVWGNKQVVIEDGDRKAICLTPGRTYHVRTDTYAFSNAYKRLRLHLAGNETYSLQHDLTLSGQDRFIEIMDDRGTKHRFQDRPGEAKTEHSDELLWKIFKRPEVKTVAELYPTEVQKNLAIMEACELLAGFTYYPGQRDFYSRVATKNYALVGAATGTGKTLGAITLIALKAPHRALIVAPQGTTKAQRKGDEDEEDGETEVTASQWISELRRFAPGLPVFELFSHDDFERIQNLNGGTLPHGVYVTYYEAMFSNGARESDSEKLDDYKLCRQIGITEPASEMLGKDGEPLRRNPREWTDGIGEEVGGIRCIAKPCLGTLIGHHFDFVALDEGHKACHLSANVTQMIIRLQPKYRYVFTATPIPNLVSDIFPLMGWLCVPGWYQRGVRNAAWPYAREDEGRFTRQFLSTERDHTQEKLNVEADPKWRGRCEKASPVISAPARLLKLLKPTLAYISKEDCNPNKPKVTLHDIRVPMGRAQAKLYGYYMNRANVPASNAKVRAAKQVAILRDLCAAPSASRWNNRPGLTVRSNWNPKAIAILDLVRQIVLRGEQVVIVSARLNQTSFLQRLCQQAGVRTARIDSSLPPEQHTTQAWLFKTGQADVMFMGIKCAQAHSFEQCPNLIIGSLEYSFGAFEQACGRIDRVTSPRPMNVYCVLHQNTIEEVMFDVVATKGDAATICLQGKRAPRDFKAVDLGEIVAINFEKLRALGDTKGLPDEDATERQWPSLLRGIQAAVLNSTCQLAG
jgi:hypothetical protein